MSFIYQNIFRTLAVPRVHILTQYFIIDILPKIVNFSSQGKYLLRLFTIFLVKDKTRLDLLNRE